MKCVFVLAAIVVVAVATETYDTKFDEIDVETIVGDKTKFKTLVDCILGKGQCDEFGALVKRDTPDAIATACAKCTDKQKHGLRRILEELPVQFPEDYNTLKKAADPENKFFPSLLAAINNA